MGLSSQLAPSAIAKPGVCTSTTRPASPYEGQVIYQSDTDTVLFWDGAAWVTFGGKRTLYTWVPAEQFSVGLNTPTFGTIGSWPNIAQTWKHQDAADTYITTNTIVPADWYSGNITLTAYYQGGGSGNFRLDTACAAVSPGTPGGSMLTYNGLGGVTVVSHNGLATADYGATLAVSAGQMLNIFFARLGTNAADTSTNDLYFYGVKISYTGV